MPNSRRWLVTLGTWNILLLAASLTGQIAADERPAITFLCTDVRSVKGPDWVPNGVSGVQPTVAEVGQRIARRLVADPNTRPLGIRQLFEVVDSVMPIDKVLIPEDRADIDRVLWLGGRLDSVEGEIYELSFWIGDQADSVKKRGTLKELSGKAIDIISELLKEESISTRLDYPDATFKNFDIKHHVRNATTSYYLKLAGRYGYPHRRSLVTRTQSYLPPEPLPSLVHLEGGLDFVEWSLAEFHSSKGNKALLEPAARVLDVYGELGESSARYHHLRGLLAHWRTNDRAFVRSQLERSLELDPYSAETMFLVWYIRVPNEDEDWLERAVASNRGFLRARVYLARRTKDPAAMMPILDVRPYSVAYYQQALLYRDKDQIDKAYEALGRAGATGYTPTTVNRLRARIELERRDFVGAERSLVSAIAADDMTIREGYLSAIEKRGATRKRLLTDLRESVTERVMWKGSPDMEDEILLGLIAARLGQESTAAEFAENLQIRYPEPKHVLAWIGVTLIYRQMGEKDSAEEYVKLILKETK